MKNVCTLCMKKSELSKWAAKGIWICDKCFLKKVEEMTKKIEERISK